MFENSIVDRFASIRCLLSDETERVLGQVEIEKAAQILLNRNEWNMEINRFIQNIGNQVSPKMALWPEFRGFSISSLASGTPILFEPVFNDSPFDRGLAEPKIKQFSRTFPNRFKRLAAKWTIWLLCSDHDFAHWKTIQPTGALSAVVTTIWFCEFM